MLISNSLLYWFLLVFRKTFLLSYVRYACFIEMQELEQKRYAICLTEKKICDCGAPSQI